jgi:ATP-dependent Clp protease ATP-binding subunit ClpC
MLSILKEQRNIATQILNQFDVDYDLFRNELVVKSNDTRSEYTDDPDDLDEEKEVTSKRRPRRKQQEQNTGADNLEGISRNRRPARWIPL